MDSLIEELLERKTPEYQDLFYRKFSALQATEGDLDHILSKTWKLLENQVIYKDILYFSLLRNNNFELLKCCMNWEMSIMDITTKDALKDPCVLFDYTIYDKRHWFYQLFKYSNNMTKEILPTVLINKINYLQLINMTVNNCGQEFNVVMIKENILECNNSIEVDEFWKYYVKEIEYIINMYEFFQKLDNEITNEVFINLASKNSTLDLASDSLNLNEHHLQLIEWFQALDDTKVPHTEDIKSQSNTLICFSILAQLYKLLLPNCGPEKTINVGSIVEDIQTKLLSINNHSQQLELLELIFASSFLKYSQLISPCTKKLEYDKYIFNEKEIRIILFTLKNVLEQLKFKKVYENEPESLEKLNNLHKLTLDAIWRLELIVNVVSSLKCETNLLYYMLAQPDSLINICLKAGDFGRATQVLQIFNLKSTSFAKEILFTKKLQDLKETLSTTCRVRRIQKDTPDLTISSAKLQFDDIVEDFFRKNFIEECRESDELIERFVEEYPFLEHYKSGSEIMMNILDLAISHTESFDDSRALLHLASKYNTLSEQESSFSIFSRKLLILFNEIAGEKYLTLSNIMLDPQIVLDRDIYKKEEEFYIKLEKLYSELYESLMLDEVGCLNKDHPSHKCLKNLDKHCIDYLEDTSPRRSEEHVKYMQKLFNYLKAFSKVLYIERDLSELVANGKNSSYFNIVNFNRAELIGKMLFEHNLDPSEFEKYFGKLKLDFLYHVVGNCFPTVNLYSNENVAKDELYPENTLYPPNQAVITYIKKRNWLLALILMEMYGVENVELDCGESRIKYFINYLRLPKIGHLQCLFKDNQIVTALQNEISYQKVKEYIEEEMKTCDFMLSSTHSTHSLETAEEMNEDNLKTTNWIKLFNLLESISEKQFIKDQQFYELRDKVLVHLIRDAFECKFYKYVLLIRDTETRVNLLRENINVWPEDFCIDMINAEITAFEGGKEESELEELRIQLKHIKHSKKVMSVLKISSRAAFYEMCNVQPNEILQNLLSSKRVDLLIELIELFENRDVLIACIDENFLERAFDMDIDLDHITQILKLIPEEKVSTICHKLLKMLKSVKHLQFIADYLTQDTQDESLGNILLSLKMLSVFAPIEFDQQLLVLMKEPLDIIEVLIMNTKLDKLGAVLDQIRSNIPVTEFNSESVTVEKIDELIRRYAEKSLDFRVIAQPDPRLLRTPEHKLLQSLDTINLDPESKAFIMPEEVPSKEDWIGNTEVIECMICMCSFSMFNRRHHCRRCGRVICSSCSKRRMIVPTYGDILVRVCNDCFGQTFSDSSISEDTTSTKSASDDYWMLTGDDEHNRIIREEFSYEFAPSVSLCLALMKYHSPCDDHSRFLIEQCDILLKMLIPNQEPIQEIDYMLVIRMLKSLALAAKMASQDTSIHFGSTSADRILTQAELLGLLAERGCLHLLPTSVNSTYIDAMSLMKLTEKLLEREQWKLALEVATKAGIDKSGVFAAWGLSCLKAGSLAQAREKFSKCLDKNSHHDSSYYEIESSSIKVIKNPPLLNEILKILESKKEAIDKDVITDTQKFLGSTATLTQSINSAYPIDSSAMFILNKLKNLKSIESGYYAIKKRPNPVKFEEVIYNECVYYLNKYGTGLSLVEFHLKYQQFDKALDCILKKKLSAEVFVDIYIKCLKEGHVKMLQKHMSEIDSTLITWKEHLRQICCHLEKRNYLNCLYQLQLYMGDYIRAAMTCIRFYEEKAQAFTDLVKNSNFLKQYMEHLAQSKEQEQWVALETVKTIDEEILQETFISSPLIKTMSEKDITRYTDLTSLQMEVAKFLAERETKEVFPFQIYTDVILQSSGTVRSSTQKIGIPTLFGSNNERKYLAVLCIVCAENITEGFNMSLRIIKEFKLKPGQIYKEAGKLLAQIDNFSKISNLVNCIQSTENPKAERDELCDEMLIFIVVTLKNAGANKNNAEELIKMISDKSIKISAYIEANLLQQAFFVASKHKRLVDIKRIMREAELSNQLTVRGLCVRAISLYTHTSTSSTSSSK
ncbi:zinc finger FYVE domain-containing protein 26 homolog [Anthonomus grandis grandis]|uniref:zinc finger FYVE domain-containing protein 26 homolog n=1 Tax=Anthonomus grandis grandis TaxID=2921223 RepID=UPI0021655C50|nr:zinc finger FYVE domain-containing protein 26 homolog [Anthonomus grandis grandis]